MTTQLAAAICFLVGAIGALLTTPLARILAMRAQACANPGGRHIHSTPTPLWGGLAIVAGFILANPVMGRILHLPHLPPRQYLGLLIGAAIIVIIGIIDDRYHIPARIKFAGQIVAAAFLPLFGAGIQVISNPFRPEGLLLEAVWLQWLTTIVWIVVVTNAINLIDGLDGLAAGVSGISCCALAIIGVMKGDAVTAVMAAALAGSALGFLPWNFHPARIFMGDVGAYFIGFMIGGITAIGAFKVATAVTVFAPLLVLAVPLLETGTSALRRYLRGQPIFSADREHIHHRLMEMGFSQRATAVLMYCVTAICCMIAIWISKPK
jgi:UDP-GlcNAc:undecaprenyl-phosphate/decaprenyl-phosphate GlcNAc-1-phosphate transferase